MANELVFPAVLIPAEVEKGLAPPPIATASDIYKNALAVARSGELALRCAIELHSVDTPEQYKDALDLVKTLKAIPKKLDDQRKEYTDPPKDWASGVKGMYDQAGVIFTQAANHAEKLALGFFTREQERIANEKAELQRRLDAETKKAEAEAAERRAEEEKKRLQEAEDLRIKKEEERLLAEANGAEYTAELQAESGVESERQRQEQDRANREEADRKADEERQAGIERLARETAAAQSTLKFSAPKGGKLVWDYEVVDPDLVNRQYCDPVPSKMRAAVNSGLRDGMPMASGLRIYQRPALSGRGGGAR